MSAKLNTRDLIIDSRSYSRYENYDYQHCEFVYTLVCRADSANPNRWNVIPEVDIATFNDSRSANAYRACIDQVQKYQAIKYPKVSAVKKMLQPEIDSFRKTIEELHIKTK